MVCKKEVISWFCDLTVGRRIDFLCALMDCCSPLELRFLGTYVENLGRRDYDRLRESELHANDVSYLSKLTNITDIRILDKVLTSLALLNSRCKDGATVLYRTLKEHTDAISQNGIKRNHQMETDEKVVLLAVMALNHPAFTFSQKQALRSQLSALLQAVEGKVVPEMDEVIDNQLVTIDDLTSKNTKEQLKSASNSGPDNGEVEKVNHVPEPPPPVHIKAIEVKGLKNRQSDKRLEYTFQVHWSDSTITCVNKTYAQLFEFQCKLVQLFPEEATSEQHQDRVIPYVPGKRIFSMTPPGEQGEKTQAEIMEYAKQLSALPQHILQCDHVIQFFDSHLLEGSGQLNSGLHGSISPTVVPNEMPKPQLPLTPQQLPAQMTNQVTNQVELNKQMEQFAVGMNKGHVFPAGLAQMQPPLQPHTLQQALQQQQQPIHLRQAQPQQFQNINLQQQQQQHPTGKVHMPAHPHLAHPHMQMHLQLQQQQPHPPHHHHPQQLLSPGNAQLPQQMHAPPPPLPTTPTQNIAASVNQLHISQHHHPVNLATQVQAHNSNSSNGEGSSSSSNNGGSGSNLSMPSNNNSIVTSTVTTTSAGGNSVYYQTVSSMVFIPSPPEQYTNAGSNNDPASVSQQQPYKSAITKEQPKPPQTWPQSFTPPPTHTASLPGTPPSSSQMCISPLQSPIFRYPVAQLPAQPGGLPPAGPGQQQRDLVGARVAPFIHEWLKKQRLHKYAFLFEGMTVEQVLKLTDEQIDNWDIVKGAKGRIKNQLGELRRNAAVSMHGVNGLTPQSLGLHPSTPVGHGFFLPHPQQGTGGGGALLPHMTPAQSVYLQHQLGEGTNSECSTPPSSPRDSSDETERDSEESESSATSCPDPLQNQGRRKEGHAALQSPQQISPRDQAIAVKPQPRNQPSATSMPYSHVVKAVAVDTGRQGDRSPNPTQQQQQQQPVNDVQQQQQQQQFQLPLSPQAPQMPQLPAQPQQPQPQARVNAMQAQPLPPSNAVLVGKQMPHVVSHDGSGSPQLHPVDSNIVPMAAFMPPHMFHMKPNAGKQSVHTVQYIQGEGEGAPFRASKVTKQPVVAGARGSLASPSPPATSLLTRIDSLPIQVLSQNATPPDPAHIVARTLHAPSTPQLLPNSLHSLPISTTDGYIAPTSVTFVTAHKQNLSIGVTATSAESAAFNNNQSSYNSCTSCGCNGQCGQTNHHTTSSAPSNGNSSSSSNVATSTHPMQFNQPPYLANPTQINFPNFYPQGNMLPPGPPSSLMNHLPPSLPPSNTSRFPPPMPPSPLQGALPEMMYGNPQLGMIPHGMQMYLMGHRSHAPHSGNGGGGGGGSKKGLMCYNCGGQGHRAVECREATMESITHNSHYRLNYKSSSTASDATEGSSDS